MAGANSERTLRARRNACHILDSSNICPDPDDRLLTICGCTDRMSFGHCGFVELRSSKYWD